MKRAESVEEGDWERKALVADNVAKHGRVTEDRLVPSSVVASARRIVEHEVMTITGTILTFIALLGDDFRMILTTISFDPYFNICVGIALTFFMAEFTLSCIGKEDYIGGFFFKLDIVSTATLVLDLTFISELIGGGSEEDNTNSLKGGRTARVAKAGRVVRVLRLVRIVKLYKAYHEAKVRQRRLERQKNAGPGQSVEDDWEDIEMDLKRTRRDDSDESSESHLGKKLSELTTQRVICLILGMLLALPLLRVDVSPATSAFYGADIVLETFTDYEHGLGLKEDYDQALLNYVYYHNWFSRFFEDCQQDNNLCANHYYGQLFWIGFQGTDRDAIMNKSRHAQLDGAMVESFNAMAKKQRGLFNFGDMPPRVLELLASPWDLECHSETRSRQGLSLLSVPVDGMVYTTTGCPDELRPSETLRIYPTIVALEEHNLVNFAFYFDLRSWTMMEAWNNVQTTGFILVLLIIGSLMFTNDANRLVVRPVEKMVNTVEAIRNDPLVAVKIADAEFKAEEIRKAKQSAKGKKGLLANISAFLTEAATCQACQAPSKETMETVVLERTIIKLGSLLVLGFGEAGAKIIGHNMTVASGVNAMIPGTKVDCIIGMARVRDFSAATEVFGGRIMTVVNQIAEIVHGIVKDYHGAPNRNNGEAFLVIWRLCDSEGAGAAGVETEAVRKRTCRMAEFSIAAFAKIVAEMKRSARLADFCDHPGLQNRLGINYRVHLTMGIHMGWAIEGAVGSELKIEAAYLSPNVSLARSVERLTSVYDVCLLASGAVVSKCGKAMQNFMRLIDRITITGSVEVVYLYSLDLDQKAVHVAREKELNVVWNTRNRFKVRQLLENEKAARLAPDYNVAAIFKEHGALASMRRRYTHNFNNLFNMGFQNYIQGEWQVARRMLSCTSPVLGMQDGPSTFLLEHMEQFGFEAPKNWRGVREHLW
eukprot:TRINITY_DN32587_c0_g1_i1.p1 TRINITY_DN32587_c0_g1~~TRINITY_DN32587_c0_g1_i1.p1  ORF type:complete len:936 (+),score=275.60 TRINITY_DN32587_c0_g1_i1:236-3043(+)